MPLDGISTRCLSVELSASLCDARVDRIYQPDRHDIIIIMRRDHENLRLILSANPSAPRLHLTKETRENPSLPPMFCMLLRKHLLGSRVVSVNTPGSERIIEITFLTQNEMGDKVEKILVAELMGRHSNLILLNQDRRIHDAIVHVDAAISRVREVMPARLYVLPPDQGKRSIEDAATMLDTLSLDQTAVLDTQALLAFFPAVLHPKSTEKSLLELMGGFSPALCHEIAFQAGIDGRRALSQLDAAELRLLLLALRQIIRQTLNQHFRPTAFFRNETDAVPIDYHALSLSDCAFRKQMPSLSEAMDLFYLEKSRQNALVQKKAALTRQIGHQLDQARRRLVIHEADLQESQNKDLYRLSGDMILSYIHEIKDGQIRLQLMGDQSPDGQPQDIELDPAKSPAQNAQQYYKLYAKARNRASMSAKFLESDRSEIDWLESLESALASAEEPADMAAIREEIAAVGLNPRKFGESSDGNDRNSENQSSQGASNGSQKATQKDTLKGPQKGFEPGKPSGRKKAGNQGAQGNLGKKGQKGGAKGKAARSPAPLPPRRYISSDGFLILVGRNNLQNDQLTLKQAHKEDTWLHVQRMPGTHVIISNGKKPVPQRTLLEAAETAAYFSRASVAVEGAKVAVDYCPVSHVRKPAGARPGKVIYDRYQTLVVQPKDPKGLSGSFPETETPPEN